MKANLLEKLFLKKTKILEEDIQNIAELFPNLPPLDLIELLSAQYYEKRECHSKMVFICDSQDICSKIMTAYVEEVHFKKENIRRITKFLVATNDKYPLVMQHNKEDDNDNSYFAKGIGTERIVNDAIYSVVFNGHMNFTLYIGDQVFIKFENGKYLFPSNELEKLRSLMYDLKFSETKTNAFIDHIEKFIESKHGTTIVVCTNSCDDFYNEEKKRLVNAKRGIEITPKVSFFNTDSSVDDFFKQTSVADGGFLINYNGECEVVNVIFDGEIKNAWKNFEGKTERGSRFNSLLTYIHSKNSCCSNKCSGRDVKNCRKSVLRAFAIIISDDGMISIIVSREGLSADKAIL